MIKIKDNLDEIVITITDRDFYDVLTHAAKHLALQYSTLDIKNVAIPNRRAITFTKAADIRGQLATFGDDYDYR